MAMKKKYQSNGAQSSASRLSCGGVSRARNGNESQQSKMAKA